MKPLRILQLPLFYQPWQLSHSIQINDPSTPIKVLFEMPTSNDSLGTTLVSLPDLTQPAEAPNEETEWAAWSYMSVTIKYVCWCHTVDYQNLRPHVKHPKHGPNFQQLSNPTILSNFDTWKSIPAFKILQLSNSLFDPTTDGLGASPDDHMVGSRPSFF